MRPSRKSFIAVYFSCFPLLLSGCVQTLPQTGVIEFKQRNAVSITPDDLIAIERDVFKTITDFYPPGPTILVYRHETPDAFGERLSDDLRRAGYGVGSFDPKISGPIRYGLPISYTIDLIGSTTIECVLQIDNRKISRLYNAQTSNLVPVGPWVEIFQENQDDV